MDAVRRCARCVLSHSRYRNRRQATTWATLRIPLECWLTFHRGRRPRNHRGCRAVLPDALLAPGCVLLMNPADPVLGGIVPGPNHIEPITDDLRNGNFLSLINRPILSIVLFDFWRSGVWFLVKEHGLAWLWCYGAVSGISSTIRTLSYLLR